MNCPVCGSRMLYGGIGTRGIFFYSGESVESPFLKKPLLKLEYTVENTGYTREDMLKGYRCKKCGAVLAVPLLCEGEPPSSVYSACGACCGKCPRRVPKSDDGLMRAAELWRELGLTDRQMDADETECGGCGTKQCGIHGCLMQMGARMEKRLHSCAECPEYPCSLILDAFSKSEEIRFIAKRICGDKEFETVKEALCEKKYNLNRLMERIYRNEEDG